MLLFSPKTTGQSPRKKAIYFHSVTLYVWKEEVPDTTFWKVDHTAKKRSSVVIKKVELYFYSAMKCCFFQLLIIWNVYSWRVQRHRQTSLSDLLMQRKFKNKKKMIWLYFSISLQVLSVKQTRVTFWEKVWQALFWLTVKTANLFFSCVIFLRARTPIMQTDKM